jgi:hypothetical protein
MNGELQEKSISKVFHSSRFSTLAEILLALGLGVLAVVLHAKLRIPLKMPGHHGLEFMALLIFARTTMRMKWASMVMEAKQDVIMVVLD